jgi:hypothetical protein
MISSVADRKVYHLSPYEECAGPATDIVIEEIGLIVSVGKVNLILPHEMEADLRSVIGKRIAILRTDIADKRYIIRTICSEGDREVDCFEGHN